MLECKGIREWDELRRRRSSGNEVGDCSYVGRKVRVEVRTEGMHGGDGGASEHADEAATAFLDACATGDTLRNVLLFLATPARAHNTYNAYDTYNTCTHADALVHQMCRHRAQMRSVAVGGPPCPLAAESRLPAASGVGVSVSVGVGLANASYDLLMLEETLLPS